MCKEKENGKMYNQNDVMEIVNRINETGLVDCRGLNLCEDARLLMHMLNVPKTAIVSEIPVADNNQTVVYFYLPDDDNYYSLFAGLGANDKKFYFHLAIEGKVRENKFDFFDDEDGFILNQDYFANENINNVWSKVFDSTFKKEYNIVYAMHFDLGHDEAHNKAVRAAGFTACEAAESALAELNIINK